MAKLVEVYRNDDQKLNKRQLPLFVDENLTMVMDLSGLGFNFGNPSVRAKEIDKFLDMFNSLTVAEVRQAFSVDWKEFFATLGQTIPCVGCRRSVERLYEQLRKSGHPALEPLVITSNGTLTIKEDHFQWPRLLCTLLHGHSVRLNQLVESQFRSKKSRRCILHSLDYQRVRAPWKEVWDVMRPQCREEVLLIDAGSLMVTLEGYLQKHRFCGECRTKVLRAYWLLVEEPEPTREKGYIPALYAGIKRCLPDKHIHLPTNTEYVTTLVARVQPDIMGSSGERHAKTLEVAQGEVITCLGLCVYERLHRIQMRLKEEETTCQVLAAVAIDSLSRKFQTCVETKRGITKLELLALELTQEEIVKQQRKETKKLKRKKRRERKAGTDSKADENLVENELDDSSCLLEALDLVEIPVTCNEKAKPIPNGQNSQPPSLEVNMCNFCEKCGKNNSDKSGLNSRKCSLKANKSPEKASSCTKTTKPSNTTLGCDTCSKPKKRVEKVRRNFVCDYTQDCGYSSGNNNASSSAASSPEGSEVACCEEFCNDEGMCSKTANPPPKPEPKRQPTFPNNQRVVMSLEEMLEDGDTSSDEESYIPLEDVRQFQSQDNISQKREELRKTLRAKFAQMCSTRSLKS
uniref:Gametogenetin-binding protein 2-like n=1 Tax=Lygus hesperus TaxID=30085 RepID=A0A0A9YFG3_LYGHE